MQLRPRFLARVLVGILICMALIALWQSSSSDESKANVTPRGSAGSNLRKESTVKWVKTELPFGAVGDVLVIGKEGSLAIAGEGTVLLSSDNGSSWRAVKGGKGSYRSSLNGGETNTTLEQLGRPVPSSEPIKSLCSVEAGVLTVSGRLYLKAVCEHTTQLWSIPTKGESEPWNVFSFSYKTDPSEGVFSAGHNLVDLGERVLIDTNLPTGPALLTTSDNGTTWHPMWRGSADDSGIVGLSFPNPQDGWMLQGNGRLLRTTDGGQTWVMLSRVSEKFARNCTSMSFADSRVGFIVGLRGLLLSTMDAGITWRRQNAGSKLDLYKVLAADQRLVWVSGQKGTVLESSDGGLLWRNVELGVPNDIRFGLAIKGNRAWVVSQEYLFLSTKEDLGG